VRWPAKIKVVEFGVGLGVAAFLGWSILGLAFMLPLLELDLEPGALTTRLLVTCCQDLSLVLSMFLCGLLAGALLVTGRWAIAITATVLAAAFRAGVLLATGEPDTPWRDWAQGGLHLVFLVLSVGAFAWGFGLASRLSQRRKAGKNKAD
jgi:hypothetical protein